MDISSGISYPNANANKVLDIGNAILKKINGCEGNKYKFKRSDQIKQMGEKVLVDEELVTVPLLFVERALVCADISDIN